MCRFFFALIPWLALSSGTDKFGSFLYIYKRSPSTCGWLWAEFNWINFSCQWFIPSSVCVCATFASIFSAWLTKISSAFFDNHSLPLNYIKKAQFGHTLLRTNISPTSQHFWVDDLPYSRLVDYVCSLKGESFTHKVVSLAEAISMWSDPCHVRRLETPWVRLWRSMEWCTKSISWCERPCILRRDFVVDNDFFNYLWIPTACAFLGWDLYAPQNVRFQIRSCVFPMTLCQEATKHVNMHVYLWYLPLSLLMHHFFGMVRFLSAMILLKKCPWQTFPPLASVEVTCVLI